MLHSNLVLLSTAALVMGAGVMVGRLSDRLPRHEAAATTEQSRPVRPWPWDQLGLSADQRSKMDAIWAQTRQQIEKTLKHRRDMETDRETAIRNLLTDSQRAAYDKINSDYHQQREDLYDERDKLVEDANDQSRALLDPDQQKKWDLLTKEMRERGGMGGMGGRPGGPGMHGPHERGYEDRSTTNPTGGVEDNHGGADVTAPRPVGM
jgi:Spy/CpxP family protein refolding chaperone